MKAKVIGAIVAMLLAGWKAGTAQADTLYWDGSDTITAGAQGGTGTWNANSEANWWDIAASAGVVWPDSGTDNDAVFGGTAGTVHISGVTANDLAFNTTGYILSGANTLTLNGTTPTITTGPGISATISAMISGSSGLTKAGAGTLTLSGANTYAGVTTVNAGTLVVGPVVNVLDQYYEEVYIGPTYQGAMSLGETASPWVWRLSQTQFDVFWNTPGHGLNYPYTGYKPDSDPNLYYYVLEDNAWRGGGDKDFWDVMYKVETDGINYKLTVVPGYTAYLHNLTLGTGPGKKILIADTWHNGGKTVEVNGMHTGGGTYTVASTATLGGTGTIGSPVIVQSGGHLAPGASVGDLHVGSLAVPGSVTMSANSIYDWELGDISDDMVDIMGDLTLDPGWRLKLVDAGGTPQASNQYDLFTFTGTFSGTFAGVIDASGVSWDITYAVICLENTPVGWRVYITNLPEPATLSLLALLALSLPKRGGPAVLRRRRRMAQS